MIGGNRIGGPPPGAGQGAAPVGNDSAAAPAFSHAAGTAAKTADSQAPRDGFERAALAKSAQTTHGRALLSKGSPAGDWARLARDNPAAAQRMLAGFSAQAKACLSDIEKEMVGAKKLLEELSAKGFREAAGKEVLEKLRAQASKLAALKRRHQVMARKMALLEQVGGGLGDNVLAADIEKLMAHHRKLKSRWGRRHHLLGLGESLSCADDDTPEHLREVLRTEVRGVNRSGELSEILAAVSPRRVIAELIVRTLDGSQGQESSATAALRGEFGQAVQSYALLSELATGSMHDDPFRNDDK